MSHLFANEKLRHWMAMYRRKGLPSAPNCALAVPPEAQPCRDLIGRIFFRMAGLTDDEARELEKRLEGML